MKYILNFLTQGLGVLLSVFKKTKSSSEDGSADSNGGGRHNGINWTYIIILLLVGVGMYLVPSPLRSNEGIHINNTSHSEVAVAGIPDTTYISVPTIHGEDAIVDSVQYVATTKPVIVMPDYIDNTVVIDNDTLQGVIDATAYPYVENDTLKIDLPITWDIKPRPIESIIRVDTLKIIDSIFVEKETPFLEKPGVVAVGVSAGWIILILLL